MVSNAKKEKYYDSHKDLFNSLEKDLTHDLEEDLASYRPEITELLQDEIMGRYFYEDGAIKWTLKTDQQILKAVEILNNREQYSSILSGKSGAILVTSKDNKDPVAAVKGRKHGSRLI